MSTKGEATVGKTLDDLWEKLERIEQMLVATNNSVDISRVTEKVVEKPKTVKLEEAMKIFVATYCSAFKEKYGTRPVLDGASVAEAKRIVKAVGLERSTMLVQAYLQMDDPKYLAKCHDLLSLRMDLNRVSVALDKGRKDPHRKSTLDVLNEVEPHAQRALRKPN